MKFDVNRSFGSVVEIIILSISFVFKISVETARSLSAIMLSAAPGGPGRPTKRMETGRMHGTKCTADNEPPPN